jgi:hypothetical protein
MPVKRNYWLRQDSACAYLSGARQIGATNNFYCKGESMEWFINACAIILLACVTTVMVSLTAAGVALLYSKVKKDIK